MASEEEVLELRAKQTNKISSRQICILNNRMQGLLLVKEIMGELVLLLLEAPQARLE